jgi:hypothetical protein
MVPIISERQAINAENRCERGFGANGECIQERGIPDGGYKLMRGFDEESIYATRML